MAFTNPERPLPARWRAAALALLLTALAPLPAAATWSVVAVDQATGRVAIASATCLDRDDQFLPRLQAVVVPGKGVAAAQAAVDLTHRNQKLIQAELQKGTDPARIIGLLGRDLLFASRQFGIVDLQGRSAGHTGRHNHAVAQNAQGQVPGTGIHYAIQGNILRSGDVVPRAVEAFLGTTGALTDRVMAALEAADAAGGDSRCACPPPQPEAPAPAIPCDGKTSHVAYILMAEPDAAAVTSAHHGGPHALYLTVSQPGLTQGAGQVREGENLNPVRTLRMRYDAWRRGQAAEYR
jgi:hypothetical protein